MSSITKLILALLLSLLVGCASTSNPTTWPASEFYNQAQEAISIKDFQTAIKHYEDLEIQHPFSPYTQQAQLEVAYAYYKYDEPDSAIAAANRYIKLYPRAKDVDYAYYLRGLVSFERGMSTLDLTLGLDFSKRQPKTTKDAFRHFEDLIKRYPDSKYVNDAKQRMLDIRNRLAEYELHAANYYFRRGAYLSAVKRAQYALANYPQTPAVPDALIIIIKAYRQLGINDLADDAFKIFKLNYPEHEAINELG